MTYSIVARDDASGMIGVAVASHAFAVGRDVAFARSGVGVVATQGVPEPGHAERLLDALERGRGADAALAALVADDAGGPLRQSAVVGSAGDAVAHTGPLCIPFAGHAVDGPIAAQGNLLARGDTWSAMLAAFAAATGPLEDRLLNALSAGLAAGGDLRGQQAAALTVVGDRIGARPLIELRVDDHPQPIEELRRLIDVDRADQDLRRALEVVMGAPGDPRDAQAMLEAAQAVFGPDNLEPTFWAAVISERLDDRDVYPGADRWRTMRDRLRSLLG